MKYFILFAAIVFSLTFFNGTMAQGTNWLWAKDAGGSAPPASASANAVTADAEGNSYIAGSFSGDSIVFGPYTLHNDTTNHSTDVFIVKYDTYGNVVWAKRAGGASNDRAQAISVDSTGHLYVSGYYQSELIVFGSDTLLWSKDATFLVKYDLNGNLIWAKGPKVYLRQPAFATTNAVITHRSGNVIMAGSFTGDTIGFGSTVITGGGGYGQMFVAEYDSNGNALWASSPSLYGTGYYSTVARAACVDSAGNVYVSGSFQGDSVKFGTFTLRNANLVNPSSNIFLIKYSSTGQVVWAQCAGGKYNDAAFGVALDKWGDVYIDGYFTSPVCHFGTDSITAADTGGIIWQNFFIAKYGPGGNFRWAEDGGWLSSSYQYGALISDQQGNVYAAGSSAVSIVLGGDTLTANFRFFFLARFDTSGNVPWAQAFSTNVPTPPGTALAADPSGNIYMCGSYGDSIRFPPFQLNLPTVVNPYIAKMGCINGPFITQSNDTLSSSAATGNEWYLNGVALNDTMPVLVATANGSYTLRVNGPGCSALSQPVVIQSFVSGIGAIGQACSMAVYPNPATSLLYIKTEGNQPETTAIYDLNGQLVFVAKFSPEIDINSLAPGAYFVEVHAAAMVARKMFVKM